ncbi:MAG: chemotaxis protein CheW [Halioglobus sp.]|nr:chemotaxis protein CheW [Halioglobus sp.]
MSDKHSRWCVLIPCSNTESWAVPQNCLAEIVTLQAVDAHPPREISWRDQIVPVLDFGRDEGPPWSEQQRQTGLIAIFLGLRGEGCDYWGVAIRGSGLTIRDMATQQMENAPGNAVAHASAAFRMDGKLYQVPDVAMLQRDLAASLAVA